MQSSPELTRGRRGQGQARPRSGEDSPLPLSPPPPHPHFKLSSPQSIRGGCDAQAGRQRHGLEAGRPQPVGPAQGPLWPPVSSQEVIQKFLQNAARACWPYRPSLNPPAWAA